MISNHGANSLKRAPSPVNCPILTDAPSQLRPTVRSVKGVIPILLKDSSNRSLQSYSIGSFHIFNTEVFDSGVPLQRHNMYINSFSVTLVSVLPSERLNKIGRASSFLETFAMHSVNRAAALSFL